MELELEWLAIESIGQFKQKKGLTTLPYATNMASSQAAASSEVNNVLLSALSGVIIWPQLS